MNLKQQKYLIVGSMTAINFVLIYTFVLFNNYWYAYLPLLILSSLLTAFSSILNVLFKMCGQDLNRHNPRLVSKSYVYVIPCYNESHEELQRSLHSLIEQRLVKADERLIIIICDGKVKGTGNTLTTDAILKDLLHTEGMGYYYEYTTWDGSPNIICEYKVMYTYQAETVPIILLVKENNYGKRDSLVLIRRICHAFNRFHNVAQSCGTEGEDKAVLHHMIASLDQIFTGKIDYIIGIDADTVFDYNCTYELIQGLELDVNNHGCVGFVDIMPNMTAYNPFVLYQYAEYVYAQCLRRQAQANITNKVSCLSGCVQILRVSEETCGEKILKVFNYKPIATDNILTHIRSYASEDRNHVCNMLSLYPHVKTTQALKAIAYTVVPTSVAVFLSQRRRWNLGAITNDILLVYFPGINIFERILAFVNVLTFIIGPFVYVATVYFIMAIIFEPTLLMLYLSIILFIPIFYTFLVPLFIKPLSFTGCLYYYFAYIFFVCCSSIVSLICYFNAILQMDVLTWGKTRSIEELNAGEGVLKQIVLQLDNNSLLMETDIDAISLTVINANDANNDINIIDAIANDTTIDIDIYKDDTNKPTLTYVDVEIDMRNIDLAQYIHNLVL